MPSLFKVGVLALACASTASATFQYTLQDKYEGATFFDGFNFATKDDPTGGFVDYQSESAARSKKLAEYRKDGTNYIGVDTTKKVTNTRGRESIRIESKTKYNHGLFIVDLAHMPASVCGTWPAFWTVSQDNFPSQGEIDILENIHEETRTLHALHTDPGCEVEGNMMGYQQTAIQNTWNCSDRATKSKYGSQYENQGCAATNVDDKSYGTAFNKEGGGVYAMEWTSDVIRIWNWSPSKVPQSIKDGKPDVSKFGTPSFTTAKGKCDIDKRFKNHQIIFDTTFCGNWAGQKEIWENTSCGKKSGLTCNQYVAQNPAAFKDSYWSVKSLKVYKRTEVVSSTTKKSTTTSKTTTKSSTTSKTTTTTKKPSTTSSKTSATTTVKSTTVSTTSSKSSTTTPASSTSTSSTVVESSSSASYTSSSVAESSSSASTTSSSVVESSSSASTTSSSVVESSSSASYTSSSVVESSSSASTTSSTASSHATGSPSSTHSFPTSAPYGNHSTTAHSTTACSTTLHSTTVKPSSSIPMTTSTVYTTEIETITSCAPTVTNCPLGHVITKTIPLYTTVCPVSSNHGVPTITVIPIPPTEITSTISVTSVYTITSCAPTVTDCPGKIGQVTTEIYITTTVCPYTAKPLLPTPISYPPVWSHVPAPVESGSAPDTTVTIIATVHPSYSGPGAIYPTPGFYTTAKGRNSTVPVGTGSGILTPIPSPTKAPYTVPGVLTTKAGSPPKPGATYTPPVFEGSAGKMGASSVLLSVLAGVFALLF